MTDRQLHAPPRSAVAPTSLPGATAQCHPLAELYTPLDAACAELRRRWADSTLERHVLDYLAGDIPEVFRHQPAAVSTAHVATPHFAMRQFFSHARQGGLRPVVFEYLDDLFVTTNFDKASLAKMRFRLSRNGAGHTWHSRKVIDLTGRAEKQPLRSLQTLWGESFVDFHHRLIRTELPDIFPHDGSAWYLRHGQCPASRYLATMALFVRHAILFENFLTTERERAFTLSVVLPAFNAIREHFGVKPLIVRIANENEEDRAWWAYSARTLDQLPEQGGCRTRKP